MGFRETLNQRPRLTAAVATTFALLGIGFMLWQRSSATVNSTGPWPLFYSDDDGETCFVAVINELPPFDHNGKTAVYAQVFRCGSGGKPFIGYLSKYDEKYKAMLEAAKSDHTQTATSQSPTASDPMVVKKPHAKEWVADSVTTGKEYQKIVTPACPNGDSGQIIQLDPSDPSTGIRRE
jgi:hypothetical protein